jgi:hypothetical protein
MFRPLIDALPPGLAKWCAYALIALAPGSFVVLPVVWLIRRFVPLGGARAEHETEG